MKLKLLITIGLMQSFTLFASEVGINSPYPNAAQNLQDISLSSTQDNIRYVDADYKGLVKNGKSWATPYTSLSMALKESWSNPNITSIILAGGIYYPSLKPFNNGTEMTTNDNRDKTFHVRSGLRIIGGYSKTNTPGTNPPTRFWDKDKYPTVLSGDIGKKDHDNDNVYHVILHTKLSSTTDVSFFSSLTVKSGMSLGQKDSSINVNNEIVTRTNGAGLYSTGTNLSVYGINFERNKSGGSGGAVFLSNNDGVFIQQSKFKNNTTTSFGGAIAVQDITNQLISNKNYRIEANDFKNNSGSYGGAISLRRAHRFAIVDNNLDSNQATVGGALYVNDTQCGLVNNFISKNTSTFTAGAIYCNIPSIASPASQWLMMWRNRIHYNESTHASYGTGGVVVHGSPPKDKGEIYLASNIFWGNTGASVGALYMNSPGKVHNNTFFSNSALDLSKGAGGFLAEPTQKDNSISSVNNLFCANKLDSRVDRLGSDVRRIGTGEFTASHNLYQNSSATGFYPGSTSSIYGLDPKIIQNSKLITIELTSSSPAIDKGNNSVVMFDDQYDKPSNGTRDIGAHEFYK